MSEFVEPAPNGMNGLGREILADLRLEFIPECFRHAATQNWLNPNELEISWWSEV